jgi:hypothetical protein
MHLYAQHLPKKFREEYVTQKKQDECHLCGSMFHKLSFKDATKRSHCRKCGESVCRLCRSVSLPLSKESVTKFEKVCDGCAVDIQNLHIKAYYKEILSCNREGLHLIEEQIQERDNHIKAMERQANEKEHELRYSKSKTEALQRDFEVSQI